MSISIGQAHETELTLAKAGATDEFWVRIAQNLELARQVVAMVMNMVFHVLAKIERDMTDWECLESVQTEEGDFTPAVHEFLEDGDGGRVGGEEMILRAKRKGVASGLRHIEAMLRDQERIPVEWRKFVLVSTEVWRSPGGDRFAWYLFWFGYRWCLDGYWLSSDFDSNCRLIAPASVKKSLGT